MCATASESVQPALCPVPRTRGIGTVRRSCGRGERVAPANRGRTPASRAKRRDARADPAGWICRNCRGAARALSCRRTSTQPLFLRRYPGRDGRARSRRAGVLSGLQEIPPRPVRAPPIGGFASARRSRARALPDLLPGAAPPNTLPLRATAARTGRSPVPAPRALGRETRIHFHERGGTHVPPPPRACDRGPSSSPRRAPRADAARASGRLRLSRTASPRSTLEMPGPLRTRSPLPK